MNKLTYFCKINNGPMKRTILLLLLFVLTHQTAIAQDIWDDCPRDLRCSYPGICRLYIDTNNDGICDLGQPEPVCVEPSPGYSQDNHILDINNSDGLQISGETSEAFEVENGEDIEITNVASHHKSLYHLVPTLLLVASFYLLTFILACMRLISKIAHRKIWNALLLITFLGSAILGLILILQIDLNLNISPPFSVLYWHVEFSIAMGLIAIFHVIWHWKYFLNLLKLRS